MSPLVQTHDPKETELCTAAIHHLWNYHPLTNTLINKYRINKIKQTKIMKYNNILVACVCTLRI